MPEATSVVKTQAKSYGWRDYLAHGVYFLFYGVVKYLPAPVGNFLRYWVSKPFVRRLGKARIGEGVTIWYPYLVVIGDDVTINEFVTISGFGGVTIGDGVRIGTGTTIISSDHDFSDRAVAVKDAGLVAAPIVIAADVYFGANVTVLKGVTIGKGSVIGAGSVVTRNLPEYCIAAGVPAKVLKYRE